MDDRAGAEDESALVSKAYGTARELLRHAEEDAARIRAEADRYRRQREQEAELLVAKARRLLAMAETRAAETRAAEPRDVVIDLDAPAPQAAWDRDPPLVHDLDDDEPVRPGSRRSRDELDSILATAVSNAIDRALPSDR